MKPLFSFSVIIPAWNEALLLESTLDAVRKSAGAVFSIEIIVVDGGSQDATPEIARGGGAKLVLAHESKRSTQLNAGVRASTGEVILFLHADTLLPELAFSRLNRALASPQMLGGAFARRFDSPSLLLECTCFLAEARNRVFGWHLGDQAMFCRRSVFDQLGGFKEWDRFEDLDFSRRLRAAGRIVTLRPPVVTSARRFEREGAWRRTWRDFLLTMAYLKDDSRAIHKPQKEDVPVCESRSRAH
jgi:rSAM/selenodomain-associated transferase 2